MPRRSPPPGYVVRPAAAGDLGVLADVEVAAGELFRGIGMVELADDRGPGLRAYERARAEGRLWVAAVDGVPVGYALGEVLGGRPHLEQISVIPAHGRRGLGAALVAEVDRWAAGFDTEVLTLSTFRDVPWNGPYYASLGFEVVPADELSPELQAVRSHEQAHGLDITQRVVMARRIERTAGAT
ncbi:MAG: putative acetyltransferase [Acidimicrobiales bacterium]|nr:putative acetyltransferase [Acidimicrobiales bacterium]